MAEVEDICGTRFPALAFARPCPLTPEHDLSAFDCGEPTLNDWLRNRALKNECRFSRTYVVCEDNRVVAYFCIAAGAVVTRGWLWARSAATPPTRSPSR